MRKLKLVIMVAALAIAVQARANTFNLSFASSDNSTLGSGLLTAMDNGNGTWNVISGTFNVSAGTMTGLYSLVANPNAPAVNTISAGPGSFTYDNQLTYPGTPYLDNRGILFSMTGAWINIDLSGYYELWTVWNNGYNVVEGTVTVTSVPDGGMTIALLGGALMGLAAMRRKLFC